jgi:hypothetical protein
MNGINKKKHNDPAKQSGRDPKRKKIRCIFSGFLEKKRSRAKPINKINRRQWYDVTIAITPLLLHFTVFQPL